MSNKRDLFSLWFLLLVVFIDWLGLSLVYPLFSSILFHSNASFFPDCSHVMRSCMLGSLLAAMAIAQFFSGPVLGALSDQKGRRPVLLVSLVIAMGGYLLAAFAIFLRSFTLLLCSRVVVGIAAGNAGVVSAAVADLSDEKEKVKNFGLYGMACGIGFAVGPFIGGQLSSMGYEYPFLFAALVIFCNLLLIYFFFSETCKLQKASSANHSFLQRAGEGWKNVKKAAGMPEIRLLFLAAFVFCFSWSFFYEFIPVTWIQDWGFAPEEIGYAYAYGAFIYALASGFVLRWLVSRIVPLTLVRISLFALVLCILSTNLPLPPFSVWIYLTLINFFVAMVFPNMATLVSDFSAKDAQGEMLGIYQSVEAVAFALSPLLAAPVLACGSHFTAFVGAVTMFIAALIVVRCRKIVLVKNKDPEIG